MLSQATDVLSVVDEIRPNELDASLKERWLREAEGTVRVEIKGELPSELTFDEPLLLTVPIPYDRLYVWYVCAMIDRSLGDSALYQNDMAAYNESFGDYAKWTLRHPNNV